MSNLITVSFIWTHDDEGEEQLDMHLYHVPRLGENVIVPRYRGHDLERVFGKIVDVAWLPAEDRAEVRLGDTQILTGGLEWQPSS